MKIKSKIYFSILFFAIAIFVSSCDVGNKVIPNPNGNTTVDINPVLGSLNLIVTGDTSYTATLLSDTSSLIGNAIVNDSLQILASDGTNTLFFTTFKDTIGTYYTETSPPEITSALFIFQTKFDGAIKRFLLGHGSIIITSNDRTNKTIKGSFDVNNEFSNDAKILNLKSNFLLRYQDR